MPGETLVVVTVLVSQVPKNTLFDVFSLIPFRRSVARVYVGAGVVDVSAMLTVAVAPTCRVRAESEYSFKESVSEPSVELDELRQLHCENDRDHAGEDMLNESEHAT